MTDAFQVCASGHWAQGRLPSSSPVSPAWDNGMPCLDSSSSGDRREKALPVTSWALFERSASARSVGVRCGSGWLGYRAWRYRSLSVAPGIWSDKKGHHGPSITFSPHPLRRDDSVRDCELGLELVARSAARDWAAD